MDETAARTLSELISGRVTASLGTLHDGEPSVSMVPYAVAVDGSCFYVHVSRLAQHTADMLREPRVSLMIVEPEESGTMPQALARVTVRADAAELARGSEEHSRAREAYLARHPEAEPMFGFGDFALFALRPVSARHVGGFARATTVSAEDLVRALRR